MQANNKYIRFDWAAKRMLRDKANFAVLEGLVTVLLGEKITITEILESEGNQELMGDKYNRVDVKAKNSKDEIIIVEVQLSRQLYYLQRMLYGVSKAITEHIQLGQEYSQVKKVYSINVVYFDLGKGTDYLYHGLTEFRGVHTGDVLEVDSREENEIRRRQPSDVFPEYFIIRVNEFNDVATTPIEEWLDYLKNNRIADNTTTPGLQEAREKLLYMTMADTDRAAYDAEMQNRMVQNDVLGTAKLEGMIEGRIEGRKEGLKEGRIKGIKEGRKEGLKEGRAEEKLTIAKAMKAQGIAPNVISACTGLSTDEIEKI